MNATDTHERRDHGFTLIELLIVIVILGALAAVVVFAVGGIRDRGDEAAEGADERTLATAEESYRAIHGVYAPETELVSAGFLRDESTLLDVDVAGDLTSYTIGAAGSFVPSGGGDGGGDGGDGGDGGGDGGGGPSAPPAPQQVASYGTANYGATVLEQGGTRLLVIIGNGSETPALWSLLTTTPPADTDIVWFDGADVETTADVDAILGLGADYVIAPYSIQIQRSSGTGSTFVGTYIDSLSNWESPTDFWWTQGQGNRNPTLAEIEDGLLHV